MPGWHAVDGHGCDLATGRPPSGPGVRSAAAALAAAPVPAWPVGAVGGDGRRLGFAEALGAGGDRVERLLGALVRGGADVDLDADGRSTPAGRVCLPLSVVPLEEGVAAAAEVDRDWLATVDRLRLAARVGLLDAGRHEELEAALNVAMLVASERLDPPDDADVDAHVASGARLWLLTGAVVSALGDPNCDRFAAWARLVVAGWWPVGPSGGRLVLSAPSE